MAINFSFHGRSHLRIITVAVKRRFFYEELTPPELDEFPCHVCHPAVCDASW